MRHDSSLYDLASVNFGSDLFILREHFRGAAPIIEFSKRQFYRNELCPLRLSKASERLDPVLSDVLVVDGYRKGRGKTNPPEADYIIEELQRIAEDPSFDGRPKIGRASCEERVCQYVKNTVVAGSVKKKK